MPSGDDNDFGKQRRNLMLISALVIFSDFLDIDHEKFKIFNMPIGKAENLEILIFGLWGYFFIRFFNKFFEAESTFIQPVRKICFKSHKKIIETLYDKNGPEGAIINLINDNSLRKFSYNISFDKKSRHSTLNTDIQSKDYGVNLSPVVMKKILFFSLISYIFKTHYFTEYYVPILFGLLPIYPLAKEFIL